MGKLRPYPEYKDSGVEWIGQIPKHWQVMPGRACFYEKFEQNTGLKEKMVLSLSYGKIVVKPKEKLHGLVPESFETYQIINPGDIIIRPTDLQNDWNSLRFGIAQNRGIITSAYLCFRTKEIFNRDYGHLLLHTYDLNKVFYGLGSGLRQNLDWKDFKYLPCLVPPIEEQKAIVHFHRWSEQQIFRLISAKRRLIELLNEQKQVIIKRAVTRGLDPNIRHKPSGIEWLGDLPEHWDFTSLRRYCRVFAGATPSRSNPQYWKNGKIPWLSSGDVNQRRIFSASQFITEEGFRHSSTKWIKPLSLVVALAGQGRTKGMVATIEFATTCNQSLAAIEPQSKKLDYRFLAYVIESRYQQIRGLVGNNIRDGLNLEHVKSIPIPIPILNEQTEIVKKLDRVSQQFDTIIQTIQKDISLIEEYRSRLISDIVTGKVDICKINIDNIPVIPSNEITET